MNVLSIAMGSARRAQREVESLHPCLASHTAKSTRPRSRNMSANRISSADNSFYPSQNCPTGHIMHGEQNASSFDTVCAHSQTMMPTIVKDSSIRMWSPLASGC